MSIMLGLLIISLDSGILLFATKKLQEFGFRPNPHVDAMQLSATIFALYKSAACDNATSPGDLSISWVQQGCKYWIFYEARHCGARILTVGSFMCSVPLSSARLITSGIVKDYVTVTQPNLPHMKFNIYPSIKKVYDQSVIEIISKELGPDVGSSSAKCLQCVFMISELRWIALHDEVVKLIERRIPALGSFLPPILNLRDQPKVESLNSIEPLEPPSLPHLFAGEQLELFPNEVAHTSSSSNVSDADVTPKDSISRESKKLPPRRPRTEPTNRSFKLRNFFFGRKKANPLSTDSKKSIFSSTMSKMVSKDEGDAVPSLALAQSHDRLLTLPIESSTAKVTDRSVEKSLESRPNDIKHWYHATTIRNDFGTDCESTLLEILHYFSKLRNEGKIVNGVWDVDPNFHFESVPILHDVNLNRSCHEGVLAAAHMTDPAAVPETIDKMNKALSYRGNIARKNEIIYVYVCVNIQREDVKKDCDPDAMLELDGTSTSSNVLANFPPIEWEDIASLIIGSKI